MASTSFPSTPPDGRRAGATWVAATGAFLLLASAAVFVAVRWDQLPEGPKVALVGALTGGFLAGGRALRRTLPATGEVLFHLGALLIPIDVAALSLRLDLGWRSLLLAEGIVGVGVLGVLAVAAGSVVLAAAAGASVVVLAAGIAAVSPVPAPLALAVAAAAAHLLGRRRSAIGWAAIAGLAPVGAAVAAGVLRLVGTQLGTGRGTGVGALEELGLAGHPVALAAIVSSGVAAVVLGREAARRHDLALVALAGTCLTTGAATTWVNAMPSRQVAFLAAPALFVLVQAVAMLCQRDRFWSRPARAVALGAEVAAAVIATPVAVVLLLLAPFVEGGLDLFSDSSGWEPQPAAATGWALLAGAWLLAAWRRQSRPQPSPLAALRAAGADDRTVLFMAAAAGAAIVVGTASTVAIGAGLVMLAAALSASRRVLATAVATAAAVWAPLLVGFEHPVASLPIGLASAGVLGMAALVWRSAAAGWITTGLATAASAVAFSSCAIASDELGLSVTMLLAVASAWALAALVERASPLAGHVVRATMLLGMGAALTGAPTDALLVAAAGTLLFALEALRHDEPLVALGSALGMQLVVGATALAAGLDLATIGLLLCGTATVYAALAALYPTRWRLPFLAAAAAAVLVGLPLASGSSARLAESLILSGGMAIAAGIVLRSGILGHSGGGAATVGVALHLVVDGVTALEAFAAPVAVQLLVAGWQLRRRTTDEIASSWIAYGPAIGLAGGAALAERLAGGEAWHGLVAGAVGVAAVAAGGWRRLAGPLFLGTGIVATVTVLESLATLAGIPTWAWLATGGVSLLATGVALERSATSPIEAGRRLVDVVDERFS